MEAPKIIFPDIAATPRFALDEVGFSGANTTYFLASTDRYLLGLLNSRLAFFYFKKTFAGLEGKEEIYLRFFGQYMETFPVRGSLAHDRDRTSPEFAIAKAVDTLLEGYGKMDRVNAPSNRARMKRDIHSVENQIDRLVYTLYELTPEQVSVVESAT